MSYWTLVLEDGSELPLDGSAGLALKHISGHGMPTVTTITSEYALRDGALYQRQKVQPRVVQMLIVASDWDECGLRALRARLLEAVNPHRPHLPITLCYYDGKGDRRSLCCYYDDGLQGSQQSPYNAEEIVLRLIATQPYWLGATINSDTLDVYETIAATSNIIESDANGNWNNLSGGLTGAGSVGICYAYAPNGDLYVGGLFDHAGAVAANNIAMWDGSTWHALGAGVDYLVWSIVIDASGALYVGGEFHNAGGGAALHIAKYVPSTGVWSAVGAGLDDIVLTLAISPAGTLYAGGYFINVAGGGIALNYIGQWSGGAWSALGVTGVNDRVQALAIAPNGNLYVGGRHTLSAGLATSSISMWNGTAWSALGAGVTGLPNHYVYAIAIASNSDVYVGGTFSTAGTVPASQVAKWNGTSWSALGSGVNNTVTRLAFDESGLLYVTGVFTIAGGRAALMRSAIWTGSLWVPGWLGAVNAVVYAMDVKISRMVLVGGFTSATVPGVTLIPIDKKGANCYPVITITGPGRLLYLINYTTNQVIYFDITLLASEVLTIDLAPGAKTVTSSFRGNLISGVLAGALTNWFLQPGLNHIGCYVDSAAATDTYAFTQMYWGID